MQKIKALLINPWVYDFSSYDLWSKPLGLLYIASILEKNGFECKLIDCMDRHHKLLNLPDKKYGCGKYFYKEVEKPKLFANIPRKYKKYGLPDEIVENEIINFSPDVVLITSIMTYWYPGVFEMIKLVRKHYHKVPIILGGIYATLEYEHAKRYSGADIIFKGSEIQKLNEILYLDFVPYSFNEYPLPAFHLYNELHYIPILTSIGCPYRCSYCASHILHPKYEKRDYKSVVDEISYWHNKYKIKDFAFYDDALLYDKEHIKNILYEIINRKIKINLHTPNGLEIRKIDEEIVYLMKETGFKTIRLSFDAGDKASKDELRNVIELFNKIGIEKQNIGVYLLIGLPNESLSEIISTIEFIKNHGAKVYLAEFSPIRGTNEWEKANLQEDLDPLLTNKSIFLFKNWEIMQKIKAYAKK